MERITVKQPGFRAIYNYVYVCSATTAIPFNTISLICSESI